MRRRGCWQRGRVLQICWGIKESVSLGNQSAAKVEKSWVDVFVCVYVVSFCGCAAALRSPTVSASMTATTRFFCAPQLRRLIYRNPSELPLQNDFPACLLSSRRCHRHVLKSTFDPVRFPHTAATRLTCWMFRMPAVQRALASPLVRLELTFLFAGITGRTAHTSRLTRARLQVVDESNHV